VSSDANSKRAHDQQLMVLLKSALRAEDDNTQLSATDIWEPISKITLSHRNVPILFLLLFGIHNNNCVLAVIELIYLGLAYLFILDDDIGAD